MGHKKKTTKPKDNLGYKKKKTKKTKRQIFFQKIANPKGPKR